MPTLSSGLKTSTDPQNTKTGFSTKVYELLGNNRRLRGTRNGVEFLNIGSTGPLTFSRGNIIDGFGTLSGTTTRNAADLSTGVCLLILEGNGESITFTLGLPGSGKDFTLPENPTGNPDVGFAFTPQSGLRAPVLLDSGTGPLSTAPTAGMVTKYRLCDWSSGSRVVVGTREFKVREPNIVMEHAWQAREYGDVRRYRTSELEPLVWGTGGDSYVVGGDVLIATALINETTGQPLVQAQVRMAPDTAQRWNTWPFKGAFNPAIDTLVPPAHKIEWLDANDNIVDVTEMYSTRDANNTPGSGWPVNDPRLQQDFDAGNAPFQGWWDCTKTHDSWSHRPKRHSMALHLCPGVTSRALDQRNVTSFDADPQNYPPITDGINANGLGWLRAAPKWSRKKDTGFDTTTIDLKLADPAQSHYISQAIGFGWEPGATGQKTHYRAPGGSRKDRGPWDSPTIRYISDPNGVRPHGAVPNREIIHHWMMNEFNFGHHYFRDVHRGISLDKAKVKNGDCCYNDDYYASGSQDHRPDLGNNAIKLMVYGRDDPYSNRTKLKRDKNGKIFAGEFAPDINHNNYTSAYYGYLFASPRHVLDTRNSFDCATTAAYDFTQGFAPTEFLTRGHFAYLWQLINTWIVANDHPNSFSTRDIEEMTARHLEQVYNGVMPEYLAQNSVFGVSLKRFGHAWLEEAVSIDPLTVTDINPFGSPPAPNRAFRLHPASDFNSKSFYFGPAMMLAKQSGFFAKMHAYSPKCGAVLDLILTSLSTWAIGVFVDANGRADKVGGFVESYNVNPAFYFAGGVENLPPDWGVLCPPRGMDWIREIDGQNTSYPDGTNTQHFRAQWLWIMRDFFPEYTFPRLQQAITVVDGFYQQVDDQANAGGWYWHFLFEFMGQYKAPDYLGAPT
jgi:hypothetical protein